MLVPSPAVAVAAGPDLAVPFPQGNPQGWVKVRLTNASPFNLVVKIGGQPINHLGAWTADTFDLADRTNQPVTARVLPLVGPAPPAGDSSIYPTWAQYGDTFPGAYPYSLTAQAIATAISGLVTTTSSFRSLGSFQLLANATQGNLAITGIQPTDRYLIVGTGTSGGNGIFITNTQGLQSNLFLPVNDVASFVHLANVPLTGLDTSLALVWQWLPGGTTGGSPPSYQVWASSAPIPQTPPTGFATASLTASGNVAFTFRGPVGMSSPFPACVRIHSVSIAVNGQAFADIYAGGATGESLYGIVAPASGASNNNPSRAFTPGLIIGNGVLQIGANDCSPANLRLVASGMAAGNSVTAKFDFDLLVN